jgi:hypothetical protein
MVQGAVEIHKATMVGLVIQTLRLVAVVVVVALAQWDPMPHH